MVMRFDRPNLHSFKLFGTPWLLSAICLFFLAGCGTTSVKPSAVTAVEVPKILPTAQYLPEDAFDKDGVKLPYESVENPYALQKGRIQKDHVARYIDARRAFKANDYDKARSLLTTLTTDAPNLSGPWVMLGDIALDGADIPAAVTYFENALLANPENVNAYIRLAKVLRMQGKFIDAQNLYAKVLALWKDFPEAHLNLAILYDVYLNKPLAAQQHMEAYQFLTGRQDEQVNRWLAEIRERTGVSYSIKAGEPEVSVSLAGGQS